MANTGEIQDLTVSWEGYAGTSVEAFIKKEFTAALSGDIGTPVENYTSTGSIMPISKVYTLDGLCVTPIVENVSGALGESTNIYFPHFYKESSFEETEKLEFYKFQYSGGRWDEVGYHYVDTEDNLPSWIIGQILSKLPTATTSSNGLMSSTDKTKLDNAASISALNEKADKTTVKENERVIAEALNDLESKKANTNDVYTKTQTDNAISEYTYDKTATDNLLNEKVDKVEGKGLSTNDFKVIKLNDYLTKGDELPTTDNLIYTYYGQVVEKRMCKLDGDNDAFLFIVNRDLADYEMDDLVVLAYIRSGGSDYEYTYDGTYYTHNSDCPKWVKSACGIIYANSENAGLMPPSVYDDLLTLNEKADKTTVKENERVIAEALNDLESRKANKTDVETSITGVQSNIDSEASVREAADTALDVKISTEATTRANADTALDGKITAEKTAREAADATFTTRIDGIDQTIEDNELVTAAALNDLESRKANTSDVYTKTQTDNLLNAKADTTSLGGLTLIKLTQAEYDALTTKDSNKLYIIVG